MINNQKKAPSVVVLYWSKSGNTQKVAERIYETVKAQDLPVKIHEISESLEIPFLEYQLVFCGAPVYSFLPPDAVKQFLGKQLPASNPTRPAAPEIPGHAAVVFCTYGGGHTGVREAVPTLKYMGQFFEHAGIRVVEEWAVVGEFQKAGPEYNTAGRLGDISGRPNEQDLQAIEGKVKGLLKRLENVLGG
jgi:flavodoxin